MNNIIPLEFETHAVRIQVDADGQPWFSANDVCEALEMGNPYQAIKSHVDGDDLQKLEVIDSLGRTQLANFVNESGLYALIFGSTKESAKRFKHWVTSEVLPTIRKTGSYHAKPKKLPYQTPQIEAVLHPENLHAESILGPFFSMPDDHLHFDGVDVRKILPQFRAATRLAREIAKLTNESQTEETILLSAVNATLNVTGADLSLLFRGKPLHVDAFNEQFMSATQLGTLFGLNPPARQINAHLVNMGFQEPGNQSVLYHPTGTGLPYSEFRSFVQPDGSTRTHLLWRPSLIPVLQSYFSDLETAHEGED